MSKRRNCSLSVVWVCLQHKVTAAQARKRVRLLGGEKVMLVVMEAWGCCQMDGVALEEERVRETFPFTASFWGITQLHQDSLPWTGLSLLWKHPSKICMKTWGNEQECLYLKAVQFLSLLICREWCELGWSGGSLRWGRCSAGNIVEEWKALIMWPLYSSSCSILLVTTEPEQTQQCWKAA